ncbi:MAG TPA: hypothetical protein DC054_19225 [Blastocatellia bacterium]|nr:hypothetical protein [Blastocatellia bacterium]
METITRVGPRKYYTEGRGIAVANSDWINLDAKRGGFPYPRSELRENIPGWVKCFSGNLLSRRIVVKLKLTLRSRQLKNSKLTEEIVR